MSELGPVSQAILAHVNRSFGYIEFFRLIKEVSRKTGARHSQAWWFRRLVALSLEGRIEATVHRAGDNVTIQFRRLQEAGG